MQDGDGEEVQHWLQEAVQECDREGLLGLHRLQAAQLPLRAQAGVQGDAVLSEVLLISANLLTCPERARGGVSRCAPPAVCGGAGAGSGSILTPDWSISPQY